MRARTIRGMALITVTAGAGRTVPLHHTIATGPGGTLQYVREGDELEVDDAQTPIQRALRNGDLVRVASPRPRPEGERFSPAPTVLSGTGPPAVFGDLPPHDPKNPGPHTSEPKKAG